MLTIRSVVAALAFAVCVAATQIQPTAAAETESGAVKSFAAAQISKPFRLGASGMRRFDCSGLVYRTYFETGLLKKISGKERRARGYFRWFKEHNLITSNPRPGDLVVWAYKGKSVSHIGIFVGWNAKGAPMAISALTTGVARHKVKGINVPLKAYLRVNLDK